MVLVATGIQTILGMGLLIDGGFGEGLRPDEVAIWAATVRVLLVASITCCVLAMIAKRWVLLSLSGVLTLVLVVMNILRWNVGDPS